ncbi:1-acyl-sn-glycerol-3-phosphate acyltransferase 2-like [Ipomoea triloba]|uniref:1-acyl-sn-glycerol-3-phosphate acyltransferase 2-like n=1 Tax=Ipomoea triloba TaxID=35885 RepID=UPI00125DF65E|nr:1-acyl-sn-glycerol-3-phosphate acyltransferase 2-like [Ipomoea triloba]
MAIAAAVILPLGVLFLLSGLVINFVQAIVFALVRPISKNLYRTINKEVVEILWLQPVWLFDWWANIKIQLYIDPETYKLMGKEHALFISNHRSDIDWLVGWVLAQRAGCLGYALAVIKKAISYIPVLGWSMWFSSYIILERRWAKDESTLKAGFQELKNFPRPFWLALFPEGTRFTQAKLRAAQEYAASAGLPVPKNVLIPRTKGFVLAVNQLRSFVPAIYNMTVAIPKTEPAPTMLRMLRGHSSVVHVHIERHLMKDLPEKGSDISQWCKDIFVAKDALLEQHLATGGFANKECHKNSRNMKSLLVVCTSSCLIFYGAMKLFELCPFSWTEAAFCVVFMVLVIILMQILILASQSERSNPPKESSKPPGDGLRENLLPK